MIELDKIFENYKKHYEKILGILYPSKGSTGFTERNQTVNFARAVEEIYPSAVTWFEFQFGKNDNKHLDALIIIPEIKMILAIEAKRFSIKKKIASVVNDIVRIRELSSEAKGNFDRRIEGSSEYAFIGIILADVWTESDWKKRIKKAFESENFMEEFLSNADVTFPKVIEYRIDGFKDLEGVEKAVRENYNLLLMSWEVTD